MGCAASTVTESMSKRGSPRRGSPRVIVKDSSGVDMEVEVDFIERTRSFNSMSSASSPSDSIHACAPLKCTHKAYVQRLDKLMKEIDSQPDALLCEVSIRRKKDSVTRIP